MVGWVTLLLVGEFKAWIRTATHDTRLQVRWLSFLTALYGLGDVTGRIILWDP